MSTYRLKAFCAQQHGVPDRIGEREGLAGAEFNSAVRIFQPSGGRQSTKTDQEWATKLEAP